MQNFQGIVFISIQHLAKFQICISVPLILLAKDVVAAAKIFKQFLLEVVCCIQDISAIYSLIDVATNSYFNMSLKIDTIENRDFWQCFPFIFKDFLGNSKNKDTPNTFSAKS